MTTHSTDQLTQLLQTLESISKQLNDALILEKSVLETPDNQQLLDVSAIKKERVSSLESHTKATHLFLKNRGVNKGLYGLQALISTLTPKDKKTLVSELWLNIQSLSDANKKLNDVNGSIIELNRRYTQRSLDVLRGQVGGSHSTYGADGQSMKSKISRNLSIA
ncbi:MAG TPA: flagellar protein FlgN [Cycloclasticus sp.]|jgi:flagella synthesis protein FlgN|nr:flagellar protein FlgN [Cycloclasticus sp.]